MAYPGDNYVDWVGGDGYNFGRSTDWCGGGGSPYQGWCPFEFVFHDMVFPGGNVEQDYRGRKPYMLAEVGSNEGVTAQEGQWFIDARDDMKTLFPGLYAFVYFDINVVAAEGCCNWWLDSSTSALEGFKALATDPFFNRL